MHPYVIDQLAEDRWHQLQALSQPRRRQRTFRLAPRSVRASVGSLLIAWGATLLPPSEQTRTC